MAIFAGVEQDLNLVSGTFTAIGNSAPRRSEGPLSVSVAGTFVATVVPQRSSDGGVTWNGLSADTLGTAASWTAPGEWVMEGSGEIGVLVRLSCTAYTSGTVSYRIAGK